LPALYATSTAAVLMAQPEAHLEEARPELNPEAQAELNPEVQPMAHPARDPQRHLGRGIILEVMV
jgi:hypothetical protein